MVWEGGVQVLFGETESLGTDTHRLCRGWDTFDLVPSHDRRHRECEMAISRCRGQEAYQRIQAVELMNAEGGWDEGYLCKLKKDLETN